MKNLYALYTYVAAVCMALLMMGSCAPSNSIRVLPLGSFSSQNPLRDPSKPGNYLQKDDGTIVEYSGEASYKPGYLAKNKIVVSGKEIKLEDVKGFQQNQRYFVLDRGLRELIAQGKIDVFVVHQDVPRADGTLQTIHRYGYQQEGDKKVRYLELKNLQTLVKDCPLASAKASLSPAEITKAIKENPRYLNEIIELYNNGCNKPTLALNSH